MLGFDDSSWQSAIPYNTNGGWPHTTVVPEIPHDAYWIWLDDQEYEGTVHCRYVPGKNTNL